MSKLIELQNQRAETFQKMEDLLALVSKEDRDFSEQEEKDYSEMEKSLDSIETDITAEERKEERVARVAKVKDELETIKPVHAPDTRVTSDDPAFRNFGEYIATIAGSPGDPRLQELRVQQMKNGVSGGFAIPEQFREELLMVDPQTATFRPRAMVIPAGDPPDAKLTMPALDQGSSQNMYGGVTVTHGDESMTITESTMVLRKIELLPKKIQGYMTASHELLNNWSAASAVIPQLMRSAVTGAEDTDFLTGDGVNKALGILNAPAAIDYNRATANQIAWADVYNMYARLWKRGGSPVWVTSQTTLPQLVQIADASSRSIWQASAVEGTPDRLLGIPVVYNERSPALGTKGDLLLADMSAYLIKDGSGPVVAMSEHFRFQNDEVAFRITWMVDGQSWLHEAIPLEGSTSNTVSPFIVLDTP